MPPLISVIIPVYRVEAYLDRCVESVVRQTDTNLEIILVDDGSPDRSGEICDDWAKKDARIRVIHKENGGLSDARNAGLAIAAGEYIGFVDSDDRLDPRFFEILLDRLETTESDICSCHAFAFSEDTVPIPENIGKTTVYHGEGALQALIDGRITQTVWNKLYRRSVLQGIHFPVGKQHEDEFWSYPVIARAKRVAEVDFAGYHYFQRPDSIMGSRYSLRNLDGLEAKAQRQQFLQAQFPKLASQGRIDLNFFCMYHGQKALTFLQKDAQSKALSYVKTVLRENRLTAEDQKELPFTHRIWYTLSRISPGLTFRIRNLLKRGL